MKKGRPAKPNRHELHMYTDDELASFRKRELMADAELLDGTSFPPATNILLTGLCRETQKCEAELERPEGLQEA